MACLEARDGNMEIQRLLRDAGAQIAGIHQRCGSTSTLSSLNVVGGITAMISVTIWRTADIALAINGCSEAK